MEIKIRILKSMEGDEIACDLRDFELLSKETKKQLIKEMKEN